MTKEQMTEMNNEQTTERNTEDIKPAPVGEGAPAETKPVNSRKTELTVMSVLSCLVVIFAHCSAIPVTQLDKTTWQYFIILALWRVAHFALHSFFFLSGVKLFLTADKTDANYPKFYLRKLTKIILPYLLWVLIYYAFFISNGTLKFNTNELIGYIFSGEIAAQLYYIIVITQFYLLAPLWIKIFRKTNPVIVLPIALMITVILGKYLPNIIDLFIPDYYFPYTDRVFLRFIFYWALGCYAGMDYEHFKESVKHSRKGITVCFAIVAVFNTAITYLSFSGIKYISWLEDVQVLFCTCAILFCYSLSLWISERSNTRVTKIFVSLDKTTYYVYLAHVLVIFIVNDLIYRFGITSLGVGFIIRLAITYTVTIGLSLLYVKLRPYIFKSKTGAVK